MSRPLIAVVALGALIALTLITGWLAHGDAGPWIVGTLATVKASLIALVFLDLDRAHPLWLAGAIATFAAIGLGSAALLSL